MTKTTEKSQSLTDKLAKLESISQYFEKQDLDIDEAIAKYEEGVKLAAEVKKQLTAYELKITEIKEKYNKQTESEITETQVEITDV